MMRFLLNGPQIRALIAARDATMAAWDAEHPGGDVHEDRALEVTSECGISVETQIAAVAAALAPRQDLPQRTAAS